MQIISHRQSPYYTFNQLILCGIELNQILIMPQTQNMKFNITWSLQVHSDRVYLGLVMIIQILSELLEKYFKALK